MDKQQPMDRNELIELVKKIQLCAGTEQEIDAFVDIFLKNVPDPSALDYLHAKKYEDLTPEEIVEKALAYKPFCL